MPQSKALAPKKIARNAPCPCGSGKKYKNCCQAREKAEQAERVAWTRAAQDMRRALIGYAKEPAFVKDLALGLGLFWQDRYTIATITRMSVDETLRFFDWFAIDYTFGETNQRLVQAYRTEVDDVLSDKEAATLDAWIAALPGSAFILKQADSETGIIVIRDLILADRTETVHAPVAAKHGEIGQILLARPAPVSGGIEGQIELSGSTAVLPAEEETSLIEFMDQAWTTYQTEQPDASRVQFLRDRAYLFTHYALEWADRQGRPAVAADDPDTKPKRSGQAMQKLIKWSQDRTIKIS